MVDPSLDDVNEDEIESEIQELFDLENDLKLHGLPDITGMKRKVEDALEKNKTKKKRLADTDGDEFEILDA